FWVVWERPPAPFLREGILRAIAAVRAVVECLRSSNESVPSESGVPLSGHRHTVPQTRAPDTEGRFPEDPPGRRFPFLCAEAHRAAQKTPLRRPAAPEGRAPEAGASTPNGRRLQKPG